MNLEFEQNITTRGARKRAHTENIPLNVERAKTPTRSTIICEAPKTPVNALKQHNEQTPRRSGRKSVRPIQDYNEIVSGINLRSHMSVAEFDNEDGTEAKWTPAKVGRVSQKRSTRKSARKAKKYTKEAHQHETNEHEKSLRKNQQEDIVVDSLTNEQKTETYDDGHQKTSSDLFLKKSQISITESFTDGDLNRTFEKQEENGKVENRSQDVATILDVGVAPTVYDSERNDVASKSVTKDVEDSCLVESIQTNGRNSYDSNGSPEKNIDYHITADSCNEALDQVILLDKQQEKCEDLEMPSLLLCEDDDEDNPDQKSNISQRGNDTFNKSDCVVITPTTDANGGGKEIAAEGALYINGVDSPLVEAEKKVNEIQMKYFNSNKKQMKNIPEIEVQPATPVPFEKRKLTDSAKNLTQRKTPIKKASKTQTESLKSGYRFPTPFKNKPDFKFSKSAKEDAKQELFSSSVVVGHVTSLQPKEIILRSIRKRSLSLTVDGDQRKRKIQNVTFYSPANQTVTTADLDQLLAKGTQEHDQKDQLQKGKAPRKRSNSLDENSLPSKLPKPVPALTKKGKSPGKSTSRTKLPNFAAIHEKQFQKMENLVDYVARKADRAQNLTNSALKARNALKSPRKPLTETASMLPLKVVQTNFVAKTSATAFSSENNKFAAARNQPTNERNEMSEKSNKLQERRERHMKMLKGRADKETDLKRKNNDIIKGVRSNRRFDLLMQHRKAAGN